MSNTYFQFKEFTIQQDQCAMKVCTDACMFGAWFAAKVPGYKTILDIGSGTGLLMLMMAQKSKALIHGIEIDKNSFQQSEENVSQSSWKERLRLFQGDVRSYSFPIKYEFIISNPPFFENDLPSDIEQEKLARHSSGLTLLELIEVLDKQLGPHGSFGILLPFHRSAYFISKAEEYNFHLLEKLSIRHSSNHEFTRVIMHFGRHQQNLVSHVEMSIHNDTDGGYTKEFANLLKDYYLYL